MQLGSATLSNNPEFGALEFPTFRRFFISAVDHVIPHARNNYHPHMLSHRMLGLLSLLLMTVKIVSVSLVAITPAATVTASAITNESVITLANEARVENGMGELIPNSLLTRAAQNKANDMLARQYFAHNTPDGATPWTFIKATGYNYITAGENLAIDFSEAESVQSAWMNSPGHRANILNANFKEIGIGISKGQFNGHETIIVVQMFGTPIAQPVTTHQQPTYVAPAAPVATPVPTQVPVVQQAVPAPTPAPVNASHDTVVAPTAQPVVPVAVTPEAIGIKSSEVKLQGHDLNLTVTASSSAVKILAIFGKHSVMLDPVGNNIWRTNIAIGKISKFDNLAVQAYDMYGHIHQEPVAQFSQTLKPVMKDTGNVEGASVKVFGTQLNTKVMEEKIFLIVMAMLLAALVLAIAIKRHVQHVALIANTSFVVMLAAILYMV